MVIIGRKKEMRELQRFKDSKKPELVIMYGRRRVGKTYLIRQFFDSKFSFYFSGTVNTSNAANLSAFDEAIVEYGGEASDPSKNWSDAFKKLKNLIAADNTGSKKVVFIDEMPWLDVKGSDFLAAFDYFWNTWASSLPEMLFIGCGSATSWITKKLFRNRGGLHNRVTGRIYLAPFSLGECEQFFKSRNVVMTRYQMAECYMIFGGIPYYLDLFRADASFTQNVDLLCFAENAPLKYEFEELYKSLFSNPSRHIAIVEALSKVRCGMDRSRLSSACKLPPNGHFTETLGELEQCGFIEKYTDFGKSRKGVHYYLKDPFTLFYLRYMKENNTRDEYFWANYSEDGGHRAWCGYAFEHLCRMHIRQIKHKLGIFGVSTTAMPWRSKEASPAAQIDLVIKRRDGVVNLCEMKYCAHPYVISEDDSLSLEYKKSVFLMETGERSAIHITMVTTYGVAEKGYRASAHSEVTLNDLFVVV